MARALSTDWSLSGPNNSQGRCFLLTTTWQAGVACSLGLWISRFSWGPTGSARSLHGSIPWISARDPQAMTAASINILQAPLHGYCPKIVSCICRWLADEA
ncbi:hypothetical protein BJY00DRAFT_95443 [Aspergillus carlsbadensis]|nr:hypothetical protein BJY00DRAFT_95443 [Aspergillus carlsbadensis]